MSTFKGVIDEFPDIQVDHFRPRPDGRLPLRCFLSHIHSDHLDGLLTFKSPFIHCSPATKELLIRLERRKQRSMFANGITEAREQQYKYLKDILKPIPLETPTKIELEPGNEIQVTLFDANHCPGAVMFLFEGYGKAVLYTGDIRSEPWFINKLTRSPFMIDYSTGLKTLDCIYLDTSNTRSIPFPTKAEGLRELLQKMSKYPKDTIFHFSSWTYGYEEVWQTLSKALSSPIHIEAYRYRLYESLCGNATQAVDDKTNQPASGKSTKFNLPAIASEGSTLVGYNCGNSFMPGCLTKDPNARLHTCEKGSCPVINSMENAVWIRPIVTRTKDGSELAEVGIDRGDEELNLNLEFNIDEQDFKSTLRMLDASDDLHSMEIKRILVAGWRVESKRLVLNSRGLNLEESPLNLVEIVTALLQSLKERRIRRNTLSVESQGSVLELPTVITFPYSRHSSYAELCDLVRVFKPRDVYPCTVDEQHWDEANLSIPNLFGRLCSGKIFRHEKEMDIWRTNRVEAPITQDTQTTTTSQSSQLAPPTPEQRRTAQVDQPQIAYQRNSSGRLRPSDQEDNELVLTVQSRASPPPQLFASPPNAESQGLRRKAIREQLDGVNVKRVRLSDEHSRNSPIIIEDDVSEPALRGCQDENSESNFAGDVGNDVSQRDKRDQRNIEITTPMEINQQVASIDEYYDSDGTYADAGLRFFDQVDGVWRCTSCSHEIWGGPGGFCTGSNCKDGVGELPYMEVLDPEAPPLPEISHARNEDLLFEGEELKLVVGPCLDYDSSAYDSFDSDSNFQEEYDENDSFIDDSEDQVGGDLSSGDDAADDEPTGPNYEALYNQLRAQHSTLIADFGELDDAFRSFRRDIGIYSSDDEDDEMDEDGLHIVDVKVPDPITTEIVFAHALEQSQEETSDDRIQARAEAYEAAQASSWDNIEMMSTTANHTLPEIEL